MKAIKHKPTGKWLYYSDSDGEYLMSDEPIPCDPPMTDDEIATDVEDESDGKYKAKDIEVVTVHVLPDADLKTKDRNLLIDHHKWYRKWRLSVNDSSIETTVEEYFKWKEIK